jgi:predicted pyridoxine 5'-phosphate oxidase superfamily flavin-nucleotide-binding protein
MHREPGRAAQLAHCRESPVQRNRLYNASHASVFRSPASVHFDEVPDAVPSFLLHIVPLCALPHIARSVMRGLITDPQALQERVGKLPGPRDLKVIDHLDAYALRWLQASPFLLAGFGDAQGIAVTAGGGQPGFVRTETPKHLTLPKALLDAADSVHAGQGFGSLWLVPGLGETLRVNGRVLSVDEAAIVVAVEECYLHCAKALIRSAFWEAPPRDDDALPADPLAHAAASRFMALATIDREGHADLSPKGDPAGALLQAHDQALCFPDRPGNHRIDSFRNLLTQPRMAALALIPGATQMLHITGTAEISTDEAICAQFVVDGKAPRLVTRIAQLQLQLCHSPALARARLWPATPTLAKLDPAEIFKAHVKLSRTEGLQATLARAGVSVPGLMRKSLEHDYKKNLY